MDYAARMTTIDTDRLILRPIDPERDFDRWAETMADAATVRYIGNQTMDRNQAWRNMATVMGHWAIRGYGFFSVIEKQSGLWRGRIGPWYPLGWPEPEIGWTLHPDSHGQGFATEAALACRDYVSDSLGWTRFCHVIVEGNTPSAKVAEAIGSTRTGTLNGIPGISDEFCWVYSQAKPD